MVHLGLSGKRVIRMAVVRRHERLSWHLGRVDKVRGFRQLVDGHRHILNARRVDWLKFWFADVLIFQQFFLVVLGKRWTTPLALLASQIRQLAFDGKRQLACWMVPVFRLISGLL